MSTAERKRKILLKNSGQSDTVAMCLGTFFWRRGTWFFRIRIKSMVTANETIQHLANYRPTGMFGLGLIASFAGGLALLFFAT